MQCERSRKKTFGHLIHPHSFWLEMVENEITTKTHVIHNNDVTRCVLSLYNIKTSNTSECYVSQQNRHFQTILKRYGKYPNALCLKLMGEIKACSLHQIIMEA